MADKGWIAVDLDGTLAYYDEFVHDTHIGEPIPLMVARVKKHLADGDIVKIFTARVGREDPEEVEKIVLAIKEWCKIHIGQELEVTATKDYNMIQLYDDRCVQIVKNTGVSLNDIVDELAKKIAEIKLELEERKII